MLKALKFVMGAVSKKDYLPALTHYRIQNSTVRAYNGTLALCSPIALDIDCTPKAEPLYKAISHCDETVLLSLTPTGKLRVQSGGFKTLIECVTEETPHVTPDGDMFEIDGEALLVALKVVEPFIGNDASRPWTNGVLLLGQSAFVTNNVVLVEYWVGSEFPIVVNLPRNAVKEMLRIGEAPTQAQATNNSITFHYSDGRWIRTQLLDAQWPDLNKILSLPGVPEPIDQLIFNGLEKLKPFVDNLGRVYLRPGQISTTLDSEGTSYDVPGLISEGCYNLNMLSLLEGVATKIDFDTYPRPCMFQGDRLRGAIIGVKLS